MSHKVEMSRRSWCGGVGGWNAAAPGSQESGGKPVPHRPAGSWSSRESSGEEIRSGSVLRGCRQRRSEGAAITADQRRGQTRLCSGASLSPTCHISTRSAAAPRREQPGATPAIMEESPTLPRTPLQRTKHVSSNYPRLNAHSPHPHTHTHSRLPRPPSCRGPSVSAVRLARFTHRRGVGGDGSNGP